MTNRGNLWTFHDVHDVVLRGSQQVGVCAVCPSSKVRTTFVGTLHVPDSTYKCDLPEAMCATHVCHFVQHHVFLTVKRGCMHAWLDGKEYIVTCRSNVVTRTLDKLTGMPSELQQLVVGYLDSLSPPFGRCRFCGKNGQRLYTASGDVCVDCLRVKVLGEAKPKGPLTGLKYYQIRAWMDERNEI